ncbi:MAG: glyoxalase [Stygiobacter sp. RIFOXYC12_FULL_38_8]|nr:MAG: glyoxalase [Stygiobacter sp. GWC2_38_9]OGU77667.1 MAG: glyoxalase [Stygiobacter sp. RIFOXYA12_FULL_38_9]OGV09586.1 MAG: glyoxalase [Stygiobacter sp. RIFOXYB2_FULL_37_11]OGV15152.1 MAG: glyoxalase [Stygiobacter sp. RIFOXYA2_FULL_38_8]OGV16716.1 MAG: glyoxalase [Stygiobacter sp. RIFOXYC2_FULL_38_25]OGV24877.1 MAG: glyoxalase [Stygiobacter sp. RIFOXYC12_FULL_38_8]OGV82933.1 MAG: glyoxalase [Stygiobacter sp. GWF2_38_21]
MLKLNPYLNFNGNTEEAFNFYKSVFGGEFSFLMRYKDTPEAGNIPADAKNQIMHVALPLGKDNVLMGTDAPESMGFGLKVGNNVHIAIQAESREEADKLFKGLSAGGNIQMPMADMFWGDYFGSFTDKFGVQWMISFTNPK